MNPAQHLRRSTGRSFAILQTAWREAAYLGDHIITLDHLLLGLLMAGGPAAELLARHGARLEPLRQAVRERDQADLQALGIEPRPRPLRSRRGIDELHHGVTGDIEMSPAVESAMRAPARRFDEHGLLRRLLDHPSGGPVEALRLAGVDLEALRRDLALSGRVPVDHNHRTDPIPGLLDGLPETTVCTTRFLPVDLEHVYRAASEATLVRRWFQWDASAEVAGVDVLRTTRRVRRGSGVTELRRVIDDRSTGHADVAWQELQVSGLVDHDPRGFYLHLDLTEAPGGTLVRLTRGFRGYGRLGGLMRRLGAALTPLTTAYTVQNLALVAVEAARGGEPAA